MEIMNRIVKFQSLVLLYISCIIGADELVYSSNSIWKLIITPLKTPKAWHYPTTLTQECFEKLQMRFDGTTYSVSMLPNRRNLDQISTKKRDIILEPDTTSQTRKYRIEDTLVLWLRYKTGFTYSKIIVPVNRRNISTLPDTIANAVYSTITTEFTGTLLIESGPPGCTVAFSDELTIRPPATLLLPAGSYGIVTTYPRFKSRIDSIYINPGEKVKKRILLLPLE
jgi:hypothetical protein